jgi:hypothetical protein
MSKINHQPSERLVGKKQMMLSLAKTNHLLKNRIDPEGTEARSYPDPECIVPTAVWKDIRNFELPVSSDGRFGGFVRPFMKGLFGVRTNTGATTEFDGSYNYGKGSATGVSVADLPLALESTDGRFMLPKVRNANGRLAWPSTGANDVSITMNFSGSSAPIDVTLFEEDAAGTQTSTTTAVANPDSSQKNDFTLDAGTVMFWFVTAGTNSGFPFTTISVQLTEGATAIATQLHDVADFSNISDIYEEYRVVAQTALITFRGNVLEQGGQIAGLLASGGKSPDHSDLITYGDIASRSESYDGPLKDGIYAIWSHSDTRDMQFRDLSNDDTRQGAENWQYPFIVFAGVANDPDASIRLRICTIYECKSHKNYIPRLMSRDASWEIEDAAIKIREYTGGKFVMPNEIHLKKIRDFFKKAVNVGKDVYKVAKPIYDVVAPLLKMI